MVTIGSRIFAVYDALRVVVALRTQSRRAARPEHRVTSTQGGGWGPTEEVDPALYARSLTTASLCCEVTCAPLAHATNALKSGQVSAPSFQWLAIPASDS